MDLSFYDTAFQNVVDFVSPGFEKEIEFRAISELMYGKIMLMIRAAKKRKEIVRQVEAFNSKYPEWKKNPYISYLPRGKRIFIEISNKMCIRDRSEHIEIKHGRGLIDRRLRGNERTLALNAIDQAPLLQLRERLTHSLSLIHI